MAEREAKRPETEEAQMAKSGAKQAKAASKRTKPEAPQAPAAGSDAARPLAGETETRNTAEILAASSEEFRDSLQTIRGALELLVTGKVPDQDKAAQFLEIAYRETGYLSHRVSDLQIASLIETDRLRVKFTALSLGVMLEHIVQELSAIAASQEISLELQVDEELTNLQGDETLLRMALTNMLEMSLKSTPRQGRLLIHAGTRAEQMVIRVEQGSRGTETEEDRLIVQVTDGQNLAIYVAQRIAQAHDGRLEVEATESGISQLELVLPLQPTTRTRGRVLVVDDNPQAAFLLEYALQEEGFDAVKAMNGPDALKLAREQRFDLIILDVLLPGIDGFEVCHRLRAAPETASVPVIMVSAKAREEDQSTALRIGADAYFGKPLSMAQLMVAIVGLLETGDAR